jgi:hypothetical protein
LRRADVQNKETDTVRLELSRQASRVVDGDPGGGDPANMQCPEVSHERFTFLG